MIKRSWAEINLDAVKNNMLEVRRITNPHAKILATVKANGYGNGSYMMAETFLENGADMLAVATLDEGIELREKGIDAPVLIFGTCMEDMLEELVNYDITPNIYSYDRAKKLSEIAVKKNKTVKIHIKLDTGMGRIGYVIGEENTDAVNEILNISKLKNIEIEGIFSHFSTSDETDREYTKLQFKRFMSVCEELRERGLRIPLRHICNSAGVMMYPEMHLDMVRPGIILYGLYPSDEVDKSVINLIPVMTLKSRITNIKEIGPDRGISYGKEYITTEPKTKIATVAIGYADGYLRGMANGGRVVVKNNVTVPITGRICMDQCMIDVTNVHNISIGDEVILIGQSGFTMDDAAKCLNTINYEVSCGISRRIPRIYMRGGKEI